MLGRIVWGVLAGAVAIGVGVWSLNPPSDVQEPRAAAAFDGVRGSLSGAVYTHQDPVRGTQLVIRAASAVNRDGRVGGLFRTPLRSRIELRRVEVELRRGDVVLATATSATGTYDPRAQTVRLERPEELRLGGFRVAAERLLLGADGLVELAGEYAVYDGARNVATGRSYRGLADRFAERR